MTEILDVEKPNGRYYGLRLRYSAGRLDLMYTGMTSDGEIYNLAGEVSIIENVNQAKKIIPWIVDKYKEEI